MVCFSCGKAGHSTTRCPTLDETFPFMLPGWKAEKTLGGYIMISSRVAVSSSGKWRLIRGEGLAAWISSKVRPQDPGGGAARIAVPREAMDVEMRSLSVSSVVQPQSVPSRISVVLVEETEVRGAECLASGPVDKAVRLFSGVTCLSSGMGCKAGAMMPGAVGTLSPSVPDSVGPYGTLSPSDSDSVGPVGPYGTLSPSDSESVGHVGPYGTLSPSDSESVGPIGPYGTLSPSDPSCLG